jgi:hypothetical protein
MNFGDMTAQVQANLGLQDITSFSEKAYVQSLINAGVVDVLTRTRCTVRCIDLRVLAGVDEYIVVNQLLGLVDVQDGREKVNRSSTRQPSITMIRSDILRIQPMPAEDGDVQVWGIKRPQPMAGDLDTPESEQFGAIPMEFHDAIVTYGLWKAADYADDATSGSGERFRLLYEGQDGRGGRLGQIRIQVNKRGTGRAPSRRVHGLRSVSSHNSWVS